MSTLLKPVAFTKHLTRHPLLLLSTRQWLSTTAPRFRPDRDDNKTSAPPFTGPRPSPPRIADPKEQAIYEQLLAQSTGAFSTPLDERALGAGELEAQAQAQAETRHRDAPAEVKKEFEGARNPATGEVGGPKVEPLRWGGEGEWTYNGRATDF